MPSIVQICSNALTKLGAEPITSFDDNSNRSKLCQAYYPDVRDAVLRSYPWNCAIVRGTPALDATEPTYGYSYRFALPVDPYCLRVLEVEDGIEYRIEGRYLLCDESGVNIKYIARVTDPGAYDPLLISALECRLAAELAYAITRSPTLIEAMWKLYEQKLREARGVDGQEGTPEYWESNALVEVRL